MLLIFKYIYICMYLLKLLSETGAYCSFFCPISFVCHKPKPFIISRTRTRISPFPNIVAEANLRAEFVIVTKIDSYKDSHCRLRSPSIANFSAEKDLF